MLGVFEAIITKLSYCSQDPQLFNTAIKTATFEALMSDISSKTMQEAISCYQPDAKIVQIEKFEFGHSRSVFQVSINSDDDLVLYVETNLDDSSENRFRKEKKLLGLVNKLTSIPTQEIIYSDLTKDQIPYLFYIAKRIEGYNPISKFKYLPTEQKIHLLESLGRYLAELHSKLVFNCAGEFVVDNEKLILDCQDWEDWLSDYAYKWIGKLKKSRFSDLRYKAEKFFKEYLHLVEEDHFCCLHYDISPDNLLIKNGEIQGVIDWEKAISGPPEWDLGNTREAMIYRWFESDEISTNLENKFFAAYRSSRRLKQGWKMKVLYYETLQRFRYMADFEKIAETENWSQNEIENRETMYRDIFIRRQNLESIVK